MIVIMRRAIRGELRVLLIAAITGSLLLGLGGCATRGGDVPYDVAEFGPPDIEALDVPSGQQRIGPLDKLEIKVFQVEELSGEFLVDASGAIQYPLLGAIRAQGRPAAELRDHISLLLSQRYLQDPDVQVTISEQRGHTITVDGAVRNPGAKPIQGATTLMRAVALGEGLMEDANPARVVVFRTINGEKMAAAFDLRAIRQAQAEDPAIYGNDIVVVVGNRTRSLFREFLQAVPLLGLFRPYTY